MARRCGTCLIDIEHKRIDAGYCSRPCRNVQWLKDNAEHVRQRDRASYAADPTRKRASAIAYASRNKEARAAYAKNYRDNHSDRRRAVHDVRFDRIHGNPGYVPFDAADWEKLKRQYNNLCAYCKTPSSKTLEKDHVIPLAKGGRHAIANILPACNSCNSRKSALFLAEWRLRDLKAAAKLAA